MFVTAYSINDSIVSGDWGELFKALLENMISFDFVKSNFTSAQLDVLRAPQYRNFTTQYKSVQNLICFLHTSTDQYSTSIFIQIQYKTKQFQNPDYSPVQFSTTSNKKDIISTVQSSAHIWTELNCYYKNQISNFLFVYFLAVF